MNTYTADHPVKDYATDPGVTKDIFLENLDVAKYLSTGDYEGSIIKPCEFASWGGEFKDRTLREAFKDLKNQPLFWSYLLRCWPQYIDAELQDILVDNLKGNELFQERLVRLLEAESAKSKEKL